MVPAFHGAARIGAGERRRAGDTGRTGTADWGAAGGADPAGAAGGREDEGGQRGHSLQRAPRAGRDLRPRTGPGGPGRRREPSYRNVRTAVEPRAGPTPSGRITP